MPRPLRLLIALPVLVALGCSNSDGPVAGPPPAPGTVEMPKGGTGVVPMPGTPRAPTGAGAS